MVHFLLQIYTFFIIYNTFFTLFHDKRTDLSIFRLSYKSLPITNRCVCQKCVPIHDRPFTSPYLIIIYLYLNFK